MNQDTLKTAGYKCFAGGSHGLLNGAKALYQKKVRGDNGLALYWINIYEWILPQMGSPAQFSAEVLLYRDKDPESVNGFEIRLNSIGDMSVETVERFVEETHERMGCGEDQDNP